MGEEGEGKKRVGKRRVVPLQLETQDPAVGGKGRKARWGAWVVASRNLFFHFKH